MVFPSTQPVIILIIIIIIFIINIFFYDQTLVLVYISTFLYRKKIKYIIRSEVWTFMSNLCGVVLHYKSLVNVEDKVYIPLIPATFESDSL